MEFHRLERFSWIFAWIYSTQLLWNFVYATAQKLNETSVWSNTNTTIVLEIFDDMWEQTRLADVQKWRTIKISQQLTRATHKVINLTAQSLWRVKTVSLLMVCTCTSEKTTWMEVYGTSSSKRQWLMTIDLRTSRTITTTSVVLIRSSPLLCCLLKSNVWHGRRFRAVYCSR